MAKLRRDAETLRDGPSKISDLARDWVARMDLFKSAKVAIFVAGLTVAGACCVQIGQVRDEVGASILKDESCRVELTAEGDGKVLLISEKQILLLVDGTRASSLSVKGNNVIEQVVVDDLDKDGQSEIFALIGRPGRKTSEGFSLIWCEGRGLSESKSWFRAEYRPWKLAISDMDGDGRQELALAVVTLDRRTGRRENQLNIFDYERGNLYPRWFCSRNFVDFEFTLLDNEQRLITAEPISHERYALISYRWEGFGYVRDRIVCISSAPFIKEVLPCVQ